MYVQFSDATESKIIASFASPQDSNIWPHMGEIQVDDPRYVAYANPSATLPGAQAAQTVAMDAAYQSAVAQPVTYTTVAGVEKTYDADQASQNLIIQAFTLYSAVGAVPEGFYWVAVDNTQVPFTLADLKALGVAVGAQVWATFQNLQTKKAAIRTATTVAEVQAVTF